MVGESYRQDALRSVARHATSSALYLAEVEGRARRVAEDQIDGRWFRAALRPEPENPHDENAVAVDAEGGDQIGYLRRADAAAYAPVFAALASRGYDRATCPAYVTGEDREESSLGAMLCLSPPADIMAALADDGSPQR